ncbi:UNVERIFIED_CONTAM: hypothetical protein FKN15_057409 [Acipenser sinensis]
MVAKDYPFYLVAKRASCALEVQSVRSAALRETEEPSSKRVKPLSRVTSLASLIPPVKTTPLKRIGQTLQRDYTKDPASPWAFRSPALSVREVRSRSLLFYDEGASLEDRYSSFLAVEHTDDWEASPKDFAEEGEKETQDPPQGHKNRAHEASKYLSKLDVMNFNRTDSEFIHQKEQFHKSFRSESRSEISTPRPWSRNAPPAITKRRDSKLWSETFDVRVNQMLSAKEIKRQEGQPVTQRGVSVDSVQQGQPVTQRGVSVDSVQQGQPVTQRGVSVDSVQQGQPVTQRGVSVDSVQQGQPVTQRGVSVDSVQQGQPVTQRGVSVDSVQQGQPVTQRGVSVDSVQQGQPVTQRGVSVDSVQQGQPVTQRGVSVDSVQQGQPVTQRGVSVDSVQQGQPVTQRGVSVDSVQQGQPVTQRGVSVDSVQQGQPVTQRGVSVDSVQQGQPVTQRHCQLCLVVL